MSPSTGNAVRLRILVVDDEDFIRASSVRVLSKRLCPGATVKVDTAADISAAIAKLEARDGRARAG